MNKTFENLYRSLLVAIATAGIFVFDASAAVTNRPTAANNAAANRAQNRMVGRAPTMTAPKATATTPVVEPEIIEDEPTPEPEIEAPIIVDNKTSIFDDVMSEIGTSDTDAAANARSEAIRRQRALLDGASNQTTGPSVSITANACDAELRKCMMERCGNDFTKCANDSSAIWGQKIEGCRAKTKCTAHEFTLLAPEILADRDANVKMQHYDSVINCGNRYNDCIFTQCGTTLNKCLAKKDGDNAISKCASVANECKSMDNGLASRAMSVFGDLRTIATARVKADEARLYELRDLMRAQCNRLGATFDERTLDCVYTVNFFAGEDNTLMASKKLYSGDSFQCNANWFGVDITTYIENAQRLTRSQRSASAAALGAGLGTAAGLWSSGAITRARESQKAEKAVNEAACEKAGGKWSGRKCTDADGNKIEFDENGNIVDNNKKSTTGEENNNYNPAEHGFKRENANIQEPTDEELEADTSGRTCRKYYTDEWCDEYYSLYNKEKADNKAANREQRKQRRQDILNKIGTGVSNAASKVSTAVSQVFNGKAQKSQTSSTPQQRQEARSIVDQSISQATGGSH